jgi:hypothetical protein
MKTPAKKTPELQTKPSNQTIRKAPVSKHKPQLKKQVLHRQTQNRLVTADWLLGQTV